MRAVFVLLLPIVLLGTLRGQEKKKPKEVAGRADLLRHIQKRFATFAALEEGRKVRLLIEGEDRETVWSILPDAEIKVHGWWGRPDQLVPGDRVWAWFTIDPEKKPVSIVMLADEISEQLIHDQPHEVVRVEGGDVTVRIEFEEDIPPRILKREGKDLAVGDRRYLQTAGEAIREALTAEEVAGFREKQREWLKGKWRTEGLPGMITFLHPMSGEMEVMLDHEGRRWGRYLKTGDQAGLLVPGEVRAQVKYAEPWRERTRVRLVSRSGRDQLSLAPGQRIYLKVPEPPLEIQRSELPTDIGRREGARDRIDWFLATVYCPCGIEGDRCTGMFYTLSSCNVNACGAPNEFRRIIAGWIGEGLTDREVYERLRREKGEDVVRQHLLR